LRGIGIDAGGGVGGRQRRLAVPQTVGLMFWLKQKRFAGSYLFFSSTIRP
jgi:hypothetical protein